MASNEITYQFWGCIMKFSNSPGSFNQHDIDKNNRTLKKFKQENPGIARGRPKLNHMEEGVPNFRLVNSEVIEYVKINHTLYEKVYKNFR